MMTGQTTRHTVCAACTSTTERDSLAVLAAALEGGHILNEAQYDRIFDQCETLVATLNEQHRTARCSAFYAVNVPERRDA